VAALPTLISLLYAPGPTLGVVTATLDAVPDQTVTAALFKGPPSGTAWIASGTNTANIVRINVDPSVLSGAQQFTVALTFTPSAPVWGPPSVLVFQSPALAAVDVSPTQVDVGWTLPVPTSIAAVRASIYDTAANATVVSAVFTGTGGRLVPPVPLRSNGAYVVIAAGINGVASGPTVRSAPLVLAAPAITSLAYGPGTTSPACAVTVTAQPVTPAPGTVRAQLVAGDTVVAEADATGGTAVLAIPGPLAPQVRWQARLFYRSGIVDGPAGIAWAVDVPRVPAIDALYYAPGTITARLAAAPVPRATIALFKGQPAGTGWLASAPVAGDLARLTVDPSILDPASSYFVALAIDTTAAAVAWGAAVPLVFQAVTFTGATWDSGALSLRWSLPLTTSIDLVDVTLYDQTANTVVAAATADGTSARLAIPATLDPAHQFVATATGRNGNSTGTATRSPALQAVAPDAPRVAYANGTASGTFAVTLTPAAQPVAPVTLRGELLKDGFVFASQDAAAGTVVFVQSSPLDPASRWQGRLRFVSGVVAGPAGAPADIGAPPAPGIATVTFAAGTVVAVLDAVPVPQATVALFLGTPQGVQWIASATTTTAQARLTVPGGTTLDPAKSYVVAVTLDTAAAAVAWSGARPLVFQSPVLTDITADDTAVGARWTLPEPTNIAAVRATLYDQTAMAVLASGTFTGNGARFPLAAPLAVDGHYTVIATGALDTSSGPDVTLAQPLLVGAPSLSHLVLADAGTSTARVTGVSTLPAGAPQAPTLQVQLLAGGTPSGAPVSAGAGGSFSLPVGTASPADLSVRTRMTTTAGGCTLEGAWSAAAPVLASAPRITEALLTLQGSTWQAGASWTVGDARHIGSFRVSLAQGGSTLKSWTVAGTSWSDVPPAFAPAQPLTLTVTPLGNEGEGPASAGATLTGASIACTAIRCDGGRLAAIWDAPAGGSPPAYRLRLLRSPAPGTWETVAVSGPVAAPCASVPAPDVGSQPSAAWALAVDAGYGVAWSAANTLTQVMVLAPQLDHVTGAVPSGGDHGRATLAWTWPGGSAPSTPAPTAYDVLLLEGGAETLLGSVTAPASSATVPFTVAPPASATLVVRARAGAALGPASNSAQALLQASRVLFADGDATGVTVAFANVDPPAQLYRVELVTAGKTVEETWTAASPARIDFTAASGTEYQVRVTAGSFDQVAAGPASALCPIFLVGPTLATPPTVDGGDLVVPVTAPSAGGVTPTGYRVEVMLDGVPQFIQEGVTPASGALRIPFARFAGATGACQVRVRACADYTEGPAATVDAIAGTPVVSAASITAAATVSQLVATVLAGSASAVKDLTMEAALIADGQAGTPVSVVRDQATLVVPSGSKALSVVARARSAAGATGPWSAALPVFAQAPENVTVRYDGREAVVRWTAVPGSGVTGYTVTLLGGSKAASMTTTGTTARFAEKFDATRAPSVVVQVRTVAGMGWPSGAVDLFTAGWYASTSAALAPYVAPAIAPAMAAHDIVVYLPEIFTAHVTSGLPAAAPFQMAAGPAPFAYTLTMAAGSIVWAFDANAVRAPVLAAYNDLLNALTPLGLTPMGWRAVQDAIARAMPQTFAETLWYGYGFSPDSGYADLRPGMVLRAEFESYQALGPGQRDTDLLDGFVSSNTVDYDIGSYVDPSGSVWLTGFDAFLSRITARGATVPPPAAEPGGASGGGGIIDAYYAQFRRPFLRVVYPPTLLPASDSDPQPAFNVALLAAADYVTLNAATQSLRQAQPIPSAVAVMYLRGRTTLSACLRAWFDGAPLTVPVGTTVGNLLESAGRRPPVLQDLPMRGLALTRATGAAVTDPAQGQDGYAVGGGIDFRLDWASGGTYSAVADWLSLPLLPGDRLDTGAAP
jgi:hypothetical protein